MNTPILEQEVDAILEHWKTKEKVNCRLVLLPEGWHYSDTLEFIGYEWNIFSFE